jgi:predicted O-methyltransferase YrrM
MTNRSSSLDEAMYNYMLSIQPPETAAQKALRGHTAQHPYHDMQISPEQGVLLAWLVRFSQAKTVIELGVFTGYSALCIAQALPEGGRLIACDINDEWTAMAEPFWQQAGVRERIDLRIGPGEKTLEDLCQTGLVGKVDMIFIDADKTGYPVYYELALKLLRPGGLLVLDNIFLMGRVLSDGPEKKTAKAMRALNDKIKKDSRVDPVVLPISDGVTLLRLL